MANFVLLRSTVVFSVSVSGSGSGGSGSDRCGSGSGWRNSRFHIPGHNVVCRQARRKKIHSAFGALGSVALKAGADPRVAIAPLKPTKVILLAMIVYNSENSIRDLRPFCHPLFCRSSVVKYTSSLLQQ